MKVKDAFDLRKYTNKSLEAHRRWAKAVDKVETFTSLCEFAEWLGDPLLRNEDGTPTRDVLVNIHNPEVRRQLDMLTGPHAETMLKVFLVRRKVVT